MCGFDIAFNKGEGSISCCCDIFNVFIPRKVICDGYTKVFCITGWFKDLAMKFILVGYWFG